MLSYFKHSWIWGCVPDAAHGAVSSAPLFRTGATFVARGTFSRDLHAHLRQVPRRVVSAEGRYGSGLVGLQSLSAPFQSFRQSTKKDKTRCIAMGRPQSIRLAARRSPDCFQVSVFLLQDFTKALAFSLVGARSVTRMEASRQRKSRRDQQLCCWWGAAFRDYALRGIEAEAADKSSKRVVRDFKSGLDHQTFIPDQLDARGHSYTAAKMREARRQHAVGKSRPAKPSLSDKPPAQKPASRAASADGRRRQLSKDRIKQSPIARKG